MTLSKNTMRNTSSTVNKGRIKENSHASTVKTTPTKKSSKGNDIVQGCLGCLGIVILLLIALIAGGLILYAVNDNGTQKEKNEITTATTSVSNSIEEQVKQAIIDTVGETANTGEQKIIDLQVNDNLATTVEHDKVVVAYLNADENLKNSMTKGGILIDSTNILKKLFAINNIEEATFIWELPLLDSQGNKQTEPVLKVTMTRKSAANIRWDNFNWKNLENVVDTYWEHTVFK
ncbi:hypothetical protein [Aneurinibacillus aneurinilyticus]|uniref:Uncharacterized protein n=1 Tax=Aneurinibacillus aneurinilyticus ATCC 12856 TaxID=649747 RepID=U1WAZ1_ANEAE|nr:hypothetical protein [Aneurinibacillus aneurinilyticus]ERI05694.1 hypothetical protein HMPREF0083_05541 [Aneurinibacillus aneurinilyticus ATCC 12856]MED0708920.1 hypothetical protein [Aneurinibacillus aneurinilyticus]MED0722907.1 hypothetical protein [Aneurinibacillus aneurinilyticus]MED0732593.1 hypothetical protein [Aneurinibacillus aneurinilyticus]MED0740681.1 hypothetical protein [Aneurinibacillus aneurinilyticus]